MAQSRQKSYADHRRRDSEFQPGDKVYLKIIPSQVISQGKKKGKLSPRYIRPYEILEGVGIVAYRLALPLTMSNIHNVFHVSRLRKHEPDPTQKIPVEAIELREDLTYPEEPVKILDTKEQDLIVGMSGWRWLLATAGSGGFQIQEEPSAANGFNEEGDAIKLQIISV
ncbi:uncharacterized protein LOC127812734 [Diospyros lotus]|uniref:uncharacterized protein LOC127812734 n=1 Tax=Diospyros lotus TaxID=55363 RepID=UPI0022518AF0|nr:uncharacterized protein LOC127812734 [Diospyros lotus]